MATKNSNTGILIGVGAVAVFMLSKSGALSSLFSNNTSSTGTGTGTSSNSPDKIIDAAGTFQKDIVNGRANYATEVNNHPELKNPNYILTQAQRAQLLANYNDLRQAMQIWVQQSPELGNVYNAVQKWWTQYPAQNNSDGRTFFALIPSDNTPYAGPPAQTSSSGGGGSFWSGLLSVATTVVPLILGLGDPPPLGETEIQILITGSVPVKEILPFFESVEPDFVQEVDTKIDRLVNYYLGVS